jgi:hypothetical protein
METPAMEQAQLAGIAGKIVRMLAVKPEYFVTQPAELKVLRGLSESELDEFARQHGWRTVRRIGGRQIEFYNDASVRPKE